MRKNVIAFFLVCIIALCTGVTVHGQERERELQKRYRLMESELLRETRAYLDREGFLNSGVTLTRIVDGAGSREYTFTIHHGRIDRMEEGEREALKRELAEFGREAGGGFPESLCSFHYEFLVL